MTPGGFAVKAFASGALGKRRAVRQDHERPGASRAVFEGSVSQVVGAAGSGDLVLAESRPGVGGVMLMQLDVAAPRVHGAACGDVARWAVARQTPRRYEVHGVPGRVHYMDAEFVLGRRGGLLLCVNCPHSEAPGPRDGGAVNTHVGRAADVARIICRGRTAPRARVNVCRDGIAADMKPIVVVHVIDVTKEAAILASTHQAEVGLLVCLRQGG